MVLIGRKGIGGARSCRAGVCVGVGLAGDSHDAAGVSNVDETLTPSSPDVAPRHLGPRARALPGLVARAPSSAPTSRSGPRTSSPMHQHPATAP